MNLPILLQDVASSQADIDHFQNQLEIAKRKQQEQLKTLGKLLQAGVDTDNFPLRLQLNKTHEIRVCDSIVDAETDYELSNSLQVCRTENLDQDTLMKLLEGLAV